MQVLKHGHNIYPTLTVSSITVAIQYYEKMPSGLHFILFPCAHIEETLDDETLLFQFSSIFGSGMRRVSFQGY